MFGIVADLFLILPVLGLAVLLIHIWSFPYLLPIQLGWIVWLHSRRNKSLEVTDDVFTNHIYLISVGWLPAICSYFFIFNSWEVQSGGEFFRLLKEPEAVVFNLLDSSIVSVLLFLLYLLFRKFSSRIKSASGLVRLRTSLAVGLTPFAFSLYGNLNTIWVWCNVAWQVGWRSNA